VRVLYVSKALVSAVYRDKLESLSTHCEVTALVPERWGRHTPEPETVDVDIRWERTWLSGFNHFHVYPHAGALLDEVRPDLVHIDEEPYSAVTWQFARLCRQRGIPFVFFAWQNIAKQLLPPFRGMRHRVFADAAGGIAGTPDALDVLRRLGYPGPATVIPQFGVDAHRFYPNANERRDVRHTWRASEERFVIGYAGRLVPEKGVATLVRAVSRIPDADLVIVGDGSERDRLVALVKRLGCTSRVQFLGPLPSGAVGRALRGLDLLVLPSRSTAGWTEQFGRVMVEAMATEVPVIATQTGSIPWVVNDAAVLVPPDDVEALCGAIRALVARPIRRTELATKGRELVARRFTTPIVARETVEWYRSVLGGRVADMVGVS